MGLTERARRGAAGALVWGAVLVPLAGAAVEPQETAAPSPAGPGTAAPCEEAANRGYLGFVVAVAGAASAESPSCGPARRLLVCGEPVFDGDRIRTEAGARVDLLLHGVRAQVDPTSEIQVGLTQAGGPDIALVTGRVQVLDPRTDAGAAPYRLVTPDLATVARGVDGEAFLEADATGAWSGVCGPRGALEVMRRESTERVTASPGECVLARPHLALYATARRDAKPPVAEIVQCTLIGAARDRFDPREVSAGPDGFEPGPPAQQGPSQEPCTVGSACEPPTGPPVVPPPVVPPSRPPPVVESPPVFRPPAGIPVRKP